MAERTVQFWQIVQPGGDGPLTGTFPAVEWARHLRKVGVDASLFETPNGWRIKAGVFRQKSPTHVALYRIRRDRLPSIERRGNVSDLELAEDENLAETTHVLFFPRNVIGVLYNRDGPHATRLPQYLKGRWRVDVAVVPILRRDVAQALETMRELTVVDLAIPVDRTYLLRDDGSDAIRLLSALADKSESKTVYAKFSLRGSRSPHAGTRWLDRIRGVTSTEEIGAFSKLRVRGVEEDGGESIGLDLLAEHLTLAQDVEPTVPGARAVKPRSAAESIQDAYNILRREIERAVPRVPQSDPPLRISDLAPKPR